MTTTTTSLLTTVAMAGSRATAPQRPHNSQLDVEASDPAPTAQGPTEEEDGEAMLPASLDGEGEGAPYSGYEAEEQALNPYEYTMMLGSPPPMYYCMVPPWAPQINTPGV